MRGCVDEGMRGCLVVAFVLFLAAATAAHGAGTGSTQPKGVKRLPPRVESPGREKLTCDGRIVTIGTRMEEVAAQCGEPAWRQRLYDTPVLDPSADLAGAQLYVVDEWIYNLGPDRLIRFLRFREGRLLGVRTGGYGYDPPWSSLACRDGRAFRTGMSKMEVLFACGEPRSLREGREPAERRLAVESDEWVYDFGPDRLVYTLGFRSGRLEKIITGGYGKR